MTDSGHRVLVTGGSGFLGSWCVTELLRDGHEVRTTVRDLEREPQVRAAVGTEVDPGDRLTVLAADLTSDDGWTEAAAGCSHVLHVASPFPPRQPDDADELIVPAREGTLRVLRASLAAGVERVVITSSVAAIGGGHEASPIPLDENAWTDLSSDRISPYVRSKTIAEQAARDLAREQGALDRVTFVNPGAILGPVMNDDLSFSLEAVKRLLDGMPGVPRIGFSFVDVRDVAALQIKAMSAPEAGGKRFIAVSEFLWMSEVAAALREELGERAPKVPKRRLPDLLVRAVGLVDPSIRSVVGQLGRRQLYSSDLARTTLGWEPRPARESAVDTARSMLDRGVAG